MPTWHKLQHVVIHWLLFLTDPRADIVFRRSILRLKHTFHTTPAQALPRCVGGDGDTIFSWQGGRETDPTASLDSSIGGEKRDDGGRWQNQGEGCACLPPVLP